MTFPIPEVPALWTQPIPQEVVARLIAGVRSVMGQQITASEVERRREAEGADVEDTDA